jgi:hypothetical protein
VSGLDGREQNATDVGHPINWASLRLIANVAVRSSTLYQLVAKLDGAKLNATLADPARMAIITIMRQLKSMSISAIDAD